MQFQLASHDAAVNAKSRDENCAGAEEGVEDEVAFVGGGEEDAFDEGEGLLRRMLAEAFFSDAGGRISQTLFIWRSAFICFINL